MPLDSFFFIIISITHTIILFVDDSSYETLLLFVTILVDGQCLEHLEETASLFMFFT